MRTGQIKTYNAERGFGFITPNDGGSTDDVFFHVTAIREGAEIARYADVTFDVGVDPKSGRTRATRVALVADAHT